MLAFSSIPIVYFKVNREFMAFLLYFIAFSSKGCYWYWGLCERSIVIYGDPNEYSITHSRAKCFTWDNQSTAWQICATNLYRSCGSRKIFPKHKTELTGNPLRSELIQLNISPAEAKRRWGYHKRKQLFLLSVEVSAQDE